MNENKLRELIQEILINQNLNVIENANTDTVFYNSHGQKMLFSEFIEIEVEERRNYPMRAVSRWMKKYNISPEDECIWVTKEPEHAFRYLDWDQGRANYTVENLHHIRATDGFLIPESDDGDGGFLFVYRK